ncbi:MAG: STAS domain-containing protein [Verrucomicrobia bacterium]|nr:STAS domain-containing protein [Verrucomicrobiota bacterium]
MANKLVDADIKTRQSKLNIVLDFSEALSLDKSAIQNMIVLARVLHRKRGKLILAGMPAHIEFAVKAANLHTLIPLFENTDSARAYLTAV